jgi:hypothetical protein
MAFAADHEVLIDRLDEELRAAPRPASDIFSKIIASVCSCIPILSKAGKATRIEQLIETGAWTDAALVLIELELPAWKLRRLVCENDRWFCSLSRQPNLPATLDDSVDAVHDVMPLAIMRAFVEARRRTATTPEAVSMAPQVRPTVDGIICCDNFA